MKSTNSDEPQAKRKLKKGRVPGKLGRPLWLYFLPTLIVAVVAMIGIAILGQILLNQAKNEVSNAAMGQVSDVLAGQVSGAIKSTRTLVALLAADPRVIEAVDAPGQQRDALAAQLAAQAPILTQLRILPAGWSRPDPSGDAPMGYAGLDMVKRTANGRVLPAEVHQLKTANPYLALAEPVEANGIVRGVLFAAVSLDKLSGIVDQVTGVPGQLWMMQAAEGEQVSLSAEAGRDQAPDGSVRVAESILAVAYRTESTAGKLSTLEFLGVAGLAALLIAIMAALQVRSLASRLRSDMVTAVTLGEAIKEGHGSANVVPQLNATSDTLLLLAQFAQESRHMSVTRTLGSEQATPAASDPNAAAAWQTGGDTLGVEELDSSALADIGDAPVGDNMLMPQHVFRENDIRGIAGQEITEENVARFGQALGTLVQDRGGKKILLAQDARVSSPQLANAIKTGLMHAGCDVVDLGAVPTPLLYYALKALEIPAAVMVTGGHNPQLFNGFKIQLGDQVLAGSELRGLRDLTLSRDLRHGEGNYEQSDIADRYLSHIGGDVALHRPLKIALDGGHGVAGPLAKRLLEALGCEVEPLFCEPDGNLPDQQSDTTSPQSIEALALEVQASDADMGMLIDGDGDRLWVVDGQGQVVPADRILMLLASDVLTRHPGADVIYDVKGSRHLAGYVLSKGGRPIMWKSGHARMRSKLVETGALLAGEYSGRFYIKERWYGFDDGLYAAARLLECLAAETRPVAEIFDELPESPATPEYQLSLPEEGLNLALMSSISASADFGDAKIVDLDGMRVEFADGWGLVRASNSMPALVFRFEADDTGALERIKENFRSLLKSVDPALDAPF